MYDFDELERVETPSGKLRRRSEHSSYEGGSWDVNWLMSSEGSVVAKLESSYMHAVVWIFYCSGTGNFSLLVVSLGTDPMSWRSHE